MIPQVSVTEASILGLAVVVFSRHLFDLIRWLIQRRNGGGKVGEVTCSAGVEVALKELVKLQEGQQARLDRMDETQHARMNRLEDALKAIPVSNQNLVMEIIHLMREVRPGGH